MKDAGQDTSEDMTNLSQNFKEYEKDLTAIMENG